MSKTHQPHLEPSKLNDTSSGTPGLIASELVAEEELLLSHPNNYSSIAGDSDSIVAPKDDDKGYALTGVKLYTFITASLFAAFLSALDATVVSTLLGVIASDLHQIPNMSWIATSYLLSAAAFQPLYGKISDIFGRKPVLLACSVFFGVGCFITSFKDFKCVIIGRFITGIGGSGFNAVTTIAMSDIIPLRDRGIFQGLGNVAYSIGAASGGILGGFVNDWLGWQYVFSIQVPLSIGIGLVFLFFFVLPPGSPGLGSPGHAKEKLARIDFLGSFFLVSSLVTILLGTSLAGQYFPYISWTFGGLMLTAIVLLLVFVYVELNIAPEPILPVKLLTDRTVLSASLTNWFMTMSCFTYLFYYPVYLTSVIQLPSSKVGLRVIANFVGVSTGSLGAGIYMKRTGKYYGLNVVAVVAYWFGILSFLFLTPQSSASFQLVITFLPGWGYAIMLTVSLLALIAAVPSKFQAATTSIQYTSRFTGSTLGVCIASAIFQKILYNQLTAAIPKVVNDADKAAEIISNALADAEYSKTVSDAIRYIIVMCYERACKGAFAFSFATGCLTCVVTLFIREHKLHSNLDRN